MSMQTYFHQENGVDVSNPGQSVQSGGNSTVLQAIELWAKQNGLGNLSGWIVNQFQTLAGQGMTGADISTFIQSNITQAPGFDQLMPGYNQRIKNGYTNTDPTTGAGIAGYLAYRAQINAFAETAGLVPGTISNEDIGKAWAGDVSVQELNTRITTEYTNAINAAPAIQNELKNYGYTNSLSAGQLASYYLNPENTTTELQKQFNAATVGGEGTLTGFGEIGQSKAYALQAFLSSGGQSNVSAPQAANFFTTNVASGLSSIANMASTGFEQTQLGAAQGGPGVVSQDDLIAAAEGNAPAIQKVQRAAQTRSAGSAGGGGLSSTQSGVQGIGFGSA